MSRLSPPPIVHEKNKKAADRDDQRPKYGVKKREYPIRYGPNAYNL
jgi:hypothetical protein